MAAVGMLSGFCGTLTTPMAANFNIVPAALLELPDENAVIKAQIPDGAPAARGEHRDHVPVRLSDNDNMIDAGSARHEVRAISRSRTSSASIRTSSITCSTAPTTSARRASCIRSSTAASTGTRTCTATGCSRRSIVAFPTLPDGARRSARCSTRSCHAGERRRRGGVPRTSRRAAASSGRTGGRGC